MKVYLRHYEQADTNLLDDQADVVDIPDIIALVKSWGAYTGGDVDYEVTGQFVAQDGEAAFEIIVGQGVADLG